MKRLTVTIECDRALEIAHCLDKLADLLEPKLFTQCRVLPMRDSRGIVVGHATLTETVGAAAQRQTTQGTK